MEANGQIISKGLLVSSNSPKNEQTNSFFTTTMNSFVSFLGEFEDTKKTFQNYLTFLHFNNQFNDKISIYIPYTISLPKWNLWNEIILNLLKDLSLINKGQYNFWLALWHLPWHIYFLYFVYPWQSLTTTVVHTVILPDRTLKKWGLSNFAF